MQKMMGYMRRAIAQYDMLADGDRVAVGVSGGKDSLVLLVGLARMRRYLGIDFEVVGVTIDQGFEGKPGDFSRIEALCRAEDIPYEIVRTEIGEIIFHWREEQSPCSLCARMRRGALHDAAVRLGCNKVALGHHREDALETFLMNLMNEGRLGCFSPVSYLSRKNLHLIRPLVLAPEQEILAAARRAELPVWRNPCPVDGHTERERMKALLRDLEREDPGLKNRMFGALQRAHLSGF